MRIEQRLMAIFRELHHAEDTREWSSGDDSAGAIRSGSSERDAVAQRIDNVCSRIIGDEELSSVSGC